MRAKSPALLAFLAAALWIAAAVISWDLDGLDDTSTQLWWAGFGVFALASAFAGYSGVTQSPIWLRIIVFFGAGALGASVLSVIDIDAANAAKVVGGLGVALALVALVGLVLTRNKVDEFDPTDQAPPAPDPHHRGGRRAAR